MAIPKPQNIPISSGVYIFKHRGTPIYIGKAASLKKRLFSYWNKNSSAKVKLLLQEADRLEILETGSEIEALIKESELIKKFQPKYNVLLRDDKNYFYVGLTKENFPKIFLGHQTYKLQATSYKLNFIGPFTSGVALKNTLKLLRKIFPYCTCKTPHKRPCLNAEMGRCLNFCCTAEVNPKAQNPNYKKYQEYQNNIKNIIAILSGKKRRLTKNLKKEMRAFAQDQKFEEAAIKRNQLLGMENIFRHRIFLEKNKMEVWPKIEKELREITGAKKPLRRVEGYDISNISGQEATGSMVVFVNGRPAKEEYRRFKIRGVKGISDVDMLKEILTRRLAHKEWVYPDLMLIDGGRGQLNIALSVIKYYKLPNTKAASLAKKEEELYVPEIKKPLRLSCLPQTLSSFLQRVRDESHRFARRYHHWLRSRSVYN